MHLEGKHDAYCGLYCGACPVFIQTAAAVAAGKTDFSNPEGFCLGCKSSVVSGWCAECTLKSCAKAKGYDTCADCADYPCDPMKGFIEAGDWPYHIETPYNIALIKKEGKAAWMNHMIYLSAAGSTDLAGTEHNYLSEILPELEGMAQGITVR